MNPTTPPIPQEAGLMVEHSIHLLVIPQGREVSPEEAKSLNQQIFRRLNEQVQDQTVRDIETSLSIQFPELNCRVEPLTLLDICTGANLIGRFSVTTPDSGEALPEPVLIGLIHVPETGNVFALRMVDLTEVPIQFAGNWVARTVGTGEQNQPKINEVMGEPGQYRFFIAREPVPNGRYCFIRIPSDQVEMVETPEEVQNDLAHD